MNAPESKKKRARAKPLNNSRRRSTSVPEQMAPRRKPRRRALVVGCNYAESGNIRLKGAVNDAHLFALALTNLWEFHPKNILLLTDCSPDETLLHPADKTQDAFYALGGSQLPVRTHVSLGLKWLISGSIPGDTLVFYFAGHGLQVDNMAGWEGEGYDECILPIDCSHKDGEVNAMTAVGIRNILMSVEEDVQISIFLDCTGGQTMLDPAGTGKWKYIKGVRQKGVWPFFTDPTDKMDRAKYDSNVWMAPCMRKMDVRPRFVPGVEVSNSAELTEPAPAGQGLGRAKGFLLAAAPFDQVAVEARLPSIGLRSVSPKGNLSQLPVIPANKPIVHGIFTWALVKAMCDCVISSVRSFNGDKTVTWRSLSIALERAIDIIRSKQALSKLNQTSQLTLFRPSGSSPSDFVFYPLHGHSSRLRYSDATETSHLSRGDKSWLPRRTDYMTAWQAEAALAVHGMQSHKGRYWRSNQEKYHKDWENSFRRSRSHLNVGTPTRHTLITPSTVVTPSTASPGPLTVHDQMSISHSPQKPFQSAWTTPSIRQHSITREEDRKIVTNGFSQQLERPNQFPTYEPDDPVVEDEYFQPIRAVSPDPTPRVFSSLGPLMTAECDRQRSIPRSIPASTKELLES